MGTMVYFSKMSNLENNLRALKRLRKLTAKQRKVYVSCCNKQLVNCISEVSRNLLKGNIDLTTKQLKCLKRYKDVIRKVSCKKNSLKKRQKIITQNGGFLGALIGPAIGAITSLIGSLINTN